MAGNLYDDTLEQLPAAPRADVDPYGAAADQVIAKRLDEQRASIGAVSTAPDTAVDVLGLSKRFGLPPAVVERNFDSLKKRAATEDVPHAQILKDAPALSAYLSEPYRAAAVKDDLEPLAVLERTVRVAVNSARSLASGIPRGFAEMWGLLESGAEMAGNPQLAALAKTLRIEGGLNADFLKGSQEGSGELEQAFYAGWESLGVMVPGALMSAASGTPGPMLTTIGATTAGGAYGRGREDGLSPARANLYALTQSGVEIATEMIPASRFMKDLASNAGFRKMVLGQLGSEIPGEQVATALQDLDDWATLNPEAPFSDYLRARPDAAVETLVSTITAVGAMTVTAATLQKFAGDSGKAERAEQTKTVFDAIAGTVARMKTAETFPQAIEEVIENAAPNEKFYMPVDTFTSYWQSQGEDPAAKAAELTGDPNVYTQALKTGHDLPIPVAAYAAKISNTDHNAYFVEELRRSPDDFNRREAAAWKEDQAAKAKLEQDEAAPAETSPTAPIREHLMAQLEAAGMESGTASSQVDLYESVFTSLAERAGMNPVELFTGYGVTVQRPDLSQPEAKAPKVAPMPTRRPEIDPAQAQAAAHAERYAPYLDVLEKFPAIDVKAQGPRDIAQAYFTAAYGEGAIGTPALLDELITATANISKTKGEQKTAILDWIRANEVTRELETGLGDATIEVVDGENQENASGESAASLEALSRQEGMKERGESFVVYDRAGKARPLIGPEAVDYKPAKGETYGIKDAAGFRVLEDNGGKPPVLDKNAATAQTTEGTEDAITEQEANRIADSLGSPTENRIAASDPGSGGAVTGKRAEKHFNKVFGSILESARALDPNVDEGQLREEFDFRVAFMLDQQQLAANEGRSPHELLREIAKLGGLYEADTGMGLHAELKELGAGAKFGALAGVRGVFAKKQVARTGNQKARGHGVDVMLQMLQADPRFSWIESPEMLIDAIDEASRHGADKFTVMLPGTEELRDAGIRREKRWWPDGWAAGNMLDDVDNDVIDLGEVDTSFDVTEFNQSLFDEFDALEDPAGFDTLATGEEQPRLPEAGKVRDAEVATPALADAPFSLTAEVPKARKAEQKTLFQSAGVTPESVATWAQETKAKAGDDVKAFDVVLTNDGDLSLQMLIVARGAQRAGLGSKLMLELTRFADSNGLRVVLSPGQRDPVHGTTSRARLVKFYKRFGFVENKGRHKDFSISAGMLREPTLPTIAQATVQTETPAFKAWFGESKVVDEDGQPLRVFHGTTGTFDSFDRDRGNIESDFGAGFYFSTNANDVGENYAGMGPDLTAKLERETERIEQELEDEIDEPDLRAKEARRRATEQLAVEHGGLTMPVYLKMENPAIVGGDNGTVLTLETEYPPLSDFQDDEIEELRADGMEDDEIRRELADRNSYEPEQTGTLVDFIEAVRSVANRFDSANVDEAIAELMEEAGYESIDLERAIEILKKNEGLVYATDDNGNMAGNEIIRLALEEAGFDGIEDHTVDIKFGSQRRLGKSMAGMDADTVHYIAFEPTQIKSAIGNRGTFDPSKESILYQSVWHGSPHKFDKFSLHAMGTGEGAQAYGWGLYFASQRKIAEYYRDVLSGEPTVVFDALTPEENNLVPEWVRRRIGAAIVAQAGPGTAGTSEANVLLDEFRTRVAEEEASLVPVTEEEAAAGRESGWGNLLEAGKPRALQPWNVESRLANLRPIVAALEKLAADPELTHHTENRGRLYKVEIPESEDLLDWDKPASQQSPKVQEALRALGISWSPIKIKTPRQMAAWFRTLHAQRLWSEDIGIRESLAEAKGYMNRALEGDRAAADSLMFWQQQHQGYFSKGMIDPTGQTLYDDLKRLALDEVPAKDKQEAFKRGAELASKKLASVGVLGIKYLDGSSRQAGQGAHNFVVFDDSLVEIQEFYQPQGPADDGTKRGAIRFGPDRQMSIFLLQNANLSTFLHESGHLFLEVFGDVADKLAKVDAGARTPQQVQALADYTALLGWLGVANRSEIKDEHHEKFARGFEAYLMEGKAPSAELRTAFARYRAWLLGIYKSLRGLRVELNDDVRRVLDRLVATDQAIAEARAQAQIVPMFTTAEEAGMDPERFELYTRKIAEEVHASRERLQAKMLAEVRREQEATWKAQRAEIHDAVEAETHDAPLYRALAAIQRGTRPDGSPIVEGAEAVPMKLSRKILMMRFGAERLKRLPRPYIYTKDGGLDPDAVAPMFGYTSGDEMLKAIEAAEPMRQRIERETDRRMLEQHGSMLLDGTLQEEATAALGNEQREAIVREELRALGRLRRKVSPFVTQATRKVAAEKNAEIDKLAGEVSDLKKKARGGAATINAAIPPDDVIREAATLAVAGMRVRDIKPMVYWVAARRAGQKAVAAAARQDFDTAIAEKQHELMSLAVYREATRALEDAEARVKRAVDLGSKNAQARLGKAGDSYRNQVNAILDQYDFVRRTGKALDRRESLRGWVEAMRRQGLNVEIPDDVLDQVRQIPYRDLTIEELTGITDALDHLVHLSRLKNRLLANQDEREFEAMRDRLVGSIREHNKENKLPVAFRRRDRMKRKFREWFASHARLATHAQLMDGRDDGGAMWTAFVRPANEAATKKATRFAEASKAFSEIMRAHYPGREMNRLHDKLFIREIGDSLTLDERLAVARNWGNATSRDRMLNDPRRKWNQQQIEAILDTLDKNDLAFVQATFDFIGQYWPEIAAKQKRVTGLEPEKVQAQEIVTKNGTIPGGYFPLVADSRYNARTRQWEKLAEAELKTTAAYVSSTTKRGHTKARQEHARYTVKLEGGVVFSHLEQVIHDLTHHEMLIDTTRLLRDSKVSEAIYDTVGDGVYDQIAGALEAMAAGRLEGARNMIDEGAQFMKTRVQVALLGYNLWTALQQPLGVFNGADRVGAKWVAKGMFRWLTSPVRMERTVKWIHEVSPFMASRAGNATQDLADLRRVFSQPGGWFDTMIRSATRDVITQQRILDSMLWHIGMMQRVADVPTWLGQFEKSMAAGETEERAIALADQAIIDAQGSGRLSDLAQVQRGGPVAQLYMTFYSYGSTTFNAAYRRAGRTDFRKPNQVAGFLAGLLLIYAWPSVGTVLLSQLVGRSGGEDDEPEDFWIEVGRESLASALNGMVLVRELSPLAREESRGYSGPAGGRLIVLMTQAIEQAKQGELDDAMLRKGLAAAGAVLGLPAAQMQRTLDGWNAIEEEDADYSALLFGPPKD